MGLSSRKSIRRRDPMRKLATSLSRSRALRAPLITPRSTRSSTPSENISLWMPRSRRSINACRTASGIAPIPSCSVAPSSIRSCTGYLDHPFKNKHVQTEKDLLFLLARLVRTWQQALLIVQSDTLLRWHRELFRLVWKRKSKTASHTPKVAAQTIALIRQMATENRLWGAERIRGELLELGIRVCKRTILKYMRTVRTQQPRGQKWSTFLRTHTAQIWACDFLQVTDLFFRPLFAFFLIELQSRKVIHVCVTRSPTDAWVAQQLREATPYGQAPNYLIC